MSRNLTDYATVPSLASKMLRNFTDCALTLPFDSRHVTEFHGLPNDGYQVPRSGQAKVASHQTDGPQTKLGYDSFQDYYSLICLLETIISIGMQRQPYLSLFIFSKTIRVFCRHFDVSLTLQDFKVFCWYTRCLLCSFFFTSFTDWAFASGRSDGEC